MLDRPRNASRSFGVYALDVGQGDATFILPPDEHAPILFDCRDDHVALRFVEDWKVRELWAVVVSHLDWDHVGGLETFLKEFSGPVHRVYLSTDDPERPLRDSDPGARGAKALLDYIVSEAQKGRWTLYGTTVPESPVASGGDWSVRLLAPRQELKLALARDGGSTANNYSAVLRLELAGHAILIGGDAPLRTWASIPTKDLSARVFRVPHHGGAIDDGGRPEGWDVHRLYKEVGSEVAVVSVGTTNSYDHPHPSWIEPISGGDACRLVCTQVTARCEPGVARRDPSLVTLALRSDHFAEPPWRHLSARGAPRRDRTEVPCAGTVVAELRDNGDLRVLPARDGPHKRLVDGWKRPLCRPILGE